jgi:hypothetical protein
MHIGGASINKNTKTGNLIISCISTTTGPGITTEPIIRLDASTPLEEVAKQVVYVMSCSKSNLPIPKDWTAYNKEYLKLLGVKQNSDLYKNTISIGASIKDNIITFTPMINNGAKGFVNVPNGKIEFPANSSIKEISIALQNAFNRCE